MTAPAQQPPHTIPLNLPTIPHALTEYDHWVLWRWEHRIDKKSAAKWTKVPVDARTGDLASSTDPDTWAPFSVATHYLEKRADQVDGIGYVFAEDDPYCGIDLDNARDPETKRLTPEAQAIVDRFDSYAERSISGTGAHIIVRATLADLPKKNRTGGIEIYDRGRFFVMSGRVILNPNLIGDRQDELEAFHRGTFPEAYAAKPEPMAPLSTGPLAIDDAELLRRCQGSEKFRRLWDGNDGDYPNGAGGTDTSRADLAFCNIVVRNGGERGQVDELYRRSNRARPKWDERRGARTYSKMTLDEAFDGTVIPFTPAPRLVAHGQAEPKPHLADLPADDLPNDVASLKAIVIDLRARVIAAEERADRAEARATKLSELQSKTTGILRNNKLGQERLTGVALSYLFANREAAGDAGDGGLYRMPLARIGEPVGISEDTAGRHIQKFEKEGLIKREVRWIPEAVDPATGEITGGHRALFIGPTTNVTDFVEAVAHLDPEKPKNWGGARTQCPNHPTANIIKTTVWSCEECGVELRSETETIRPNPQDADIDELAATGTEGPRARSQQQRGRNYSSGSGAASHNDGPSPAEIERAYQQLNAIPRAPVDRYTDVAIGRNP